MTTFIALYRGQTVAEARIIAVSTDAEIVRTVSKLLLKSRTPENEADGPLAAIVDGQTRALQMLSEEEVDNA